MGYSPFSSLRLVGGTSLALQLGHRVSDDIDLFGKIEMEDEFVDFIKTLGEFRPLKRSKHINIFSINNVKLDVVNYRYSWLDDPLIIDDLRLASMKDIAAMKLNAISGRGSKKDFIDLFYLLQEFSFEEMFEFYVKKYDDGNPWLVKKSLMYFKEADEQRTPTLFHDITWEEIKNAIRDKFIKEGYH